MLLLIIHVLEADLQRNTSRHCQKKQSIMDVLGQGGFGITYLAEDHRTKSKVAVKEFILETMAMRSTASIEVRTYTDDRLENFKFGMKSFLEEACLRSFREIPIL